MHTEKISLLRSLTEFRQKYVTNPNLTELLFPFSSHRHAQAMELEACEVLADYSLQEAPFYEAPLKVGPPQPAITPQLLHQTTPQQQRHHQQPPLQRQSVSPFSLSSFRSALLGSTTSGGSMAASSLMLNSSGGSIVAVGGVGGGGKLMQHLGNSGSSVPRLQQPPSRPPPALVQSSALGGGLAKTKKFKKSVSFLPTIVQVSPT